MDCTKHVFDHLRLLQLFLNCYCFCCYSPEKCITSSQCISICKVTISLVGACAPRGYPQSVSIPSSNYSVSGMLSLNSSNFMSSGLVSFLTQVLKAGSFNSKSIFETRCPLKPWFRRQCHVKKCAFWKPRTEIKFACRNIYCTLTPQNLSLFSMWNIYRI